VTQLLNTTYLPASVTWTWTDPADTDFSHVMVYLNGGFRANVTKGVRSFGATGLMANTAYSISTRTVDSSGNINTTWVNNTARTAPGGDTAPPASVTLLRNTTYLPASITWTWTDPANADFSHVMVYLNGVFRTNVTKGARSFTAPNLAPNTLYTIGTRTVDTSGNINPAWRNNTAKTAPLDTVPPRSVTNLRNWTYLPTTVIWTWTNPTNPDFSHVMVYLNGRFQTNTSKWVIIFRASGLTPNTPYTIGTKTVDTSGNINPVWVNHTVKTAR
jgi:hypothetical protein